MEMKKIRMLKMIIRFYRREAFIRDKAKVLAGELNEVVFRFMYL